MRSVVLKRRTVSNGFRGCIEIIRNEAAAEKQFPYPLFWLGLLKEESGSNYGYNRGSWGVVQQHRAAIG